MSRPQDRPAEREEPVVITDKRKVDRDLGRGDGGSATPATTPPGSKAEPEFPAGPEFPGRPPEHELGQVPMVEAALLAERTADLQRVHAEYANYRKRAERDRLLAGELAVSRVLVDLLPVLDNLDRAREHGDLTGPLKAVADQLETALTKLGLVAFGAVGDPFDPAVHEAVLHDESEAVSGPTCTTVMRPGYKHNDRLLRAAMVGVSDPVTPLPDEYPDPTAEVDAEHE